MFFFSSPPIYADMPYLPSKEATGFNDIAWEKEAFSLAAAPRRTLNKVTHNLSASTYY